MGVDINTWRARIGNSCGLLNAIAIRKGKMHSTLHDIKTTEHRRKTRGALFWIGLALVVTLSIVTFVCLHSDSTSMTSDINQTTTVCSDSLHSFSLMSAVPLGHGMDSSDGDMLNSMFIKLLLLKCGDVEWNPGPSPGASFGIDNCVLCKDEFQLRKDQRGLDRRLISAKLRRCGELDVKTGLKSVFDVDVDEGYVCAACYNTVERGCRAIQGEPSTPTSTPVRTMTTAAEITPIAPFKTPRASKRKAKTPKKTPTNTSTPTVKPKQVCFLPPNHPNRFVPLSTSTPVRLDFSNIEESPKETSLKKALKNSQYYTAFRNILSRGEAAKKAFNQLVTNTVASQVKKYVKQKEESMVYPKLKGAQDVADFSWDTMNNDIKGKAPTYSAALHGAINCTEWRRKTKLPPKREERRQTLVKIRQGFMSSIPLYHANPWKFKFVQGAIGTLLQKTGASEKVQTILNQAGVSQGPNANRGNVTMFCKEMDKDMAEMKKSVEENYKESDDAVTEPERASDDSELLTGIDRLQEMTCESGVASTSNINGHNVTKGHSAMTLDEKSDSDYVSFVKSLKDNGQEDQSDEWTDCSDDEEDEDYLPFIDDDADMDEDIDENGDNDTNPDILQDSISSETDYLESSETTGQKEADPKSNNERRSPGYSFQWDNVQKLIHARHQGEKGKNGENQNTMLLKTMAMATEHRVPPQSTGDQTIPAKDIGIDTFLINNEDRSVVREVLETLVSRIGVHYVTYLKSFSDVVTWHIPHAHSAEMSKKSKVIPLGIFHHNPSTVDGTIDIMKELHKHVPVIDGKMRTVPCHADGLSCEHMNEAHRHRNQDLTPEERLEGTEETPQEFHHRGNVMEDSCSLLFKGGSITERGTLYQLKTLFNHRNASSKVFDSFNHLEELIRFVGEAHIVKLILKVCGMSSIDDVPEHPCTGTSKAARKEYANSIWRKVVDIIWLLPSSEEVNKVVEADINGDEWCHCSPEERLEMEDDAETSDLIRCSNPECPFKRWYHLGCKDLTKAPADDEDWWCSEPCRLTGTSEFCTCKHVKDDETVICSNGLLCEHGMKFHKTCIGITQNPGKKWKCSECLKDDKGNDGVRDYAIAVTWLAMMDMAHHDMIREGNGPGMMTIWRVNMTRFWRGNKYKYLILGHRLLAGQAGWLCPRLKEEILWNRTINLRGSPGHNIAMDRVNEFYNNEFKENLRHSHGNYTDATLYRAGKMVGHLGRSLEKMFLIANGSKDSDTGYHKRVSYESSIRKFLTVYDEDKLFDYIPGRQHESFPDFNCSLINKIQRPEAFKARLLKYTDKLQELREVAGDY